MESEISFEEFKECIILVEGKRDVEALKSIGFKRIFAVHKIGFGVRERVEQIVSSEGHSNNFCVLMDFDFAGKKLCSQVRSVLMDLGVREETRFRKMLRREGISHVEGLRSFVVSNKIGRVGV